MTKVLLVSICKEKLHELEFVKPVADILKSGDIHFEVCHYSNLCTVDELKKFDNMMQKDALSMDEVLSEKPSEFFEMDEVIEYVESFSHVIICGTSMQDNDFIENIDLFNWIKDVSVPVLGICGGFQVIGVVFGGQLKRQVEIGYYFEEFESDFMGIEGKEEVFHLHNNYIEFDEDSFNISARSDNGIVQAVKHKKKNIYGVLFHPEVRHMEIVLRFVRKK